MRRSLLAVLVASLFFVLSSGNSDAGKWPERKCNTSKPAGDEYIVIAWNDLGMHCINPSYKELAILPPFNNLRAQVIRRGDPPAVVTSGVTLEYSILNNSTVKGKTDFWQYVQQLWGIALPEGIGLTGNGLAGKMKLVGEHFEASGIPVLPYDDKMNMNPYQIATVTLKVAGQGKTVKTEAVLPVSDELNCAQCHAQGMDATVNINGGVESVDTNILTVHDYYHGTNGMSSKGPDLLGMRPVLCASCHADNAIGAKGDGRSKSLSLAMHGWHTQFPDGGCYSCHPGEMTQCLRTGIGGMGYLGDTPSCQTGLCHGGMSQLAESINQGRQPWLQEPKCEQCHGGNYAVDKPLYREGKGHGGLYCSACHNSPHAWWPSKMWADNLQPYKLQKKPMSLGDCSICHTNKMVGDSPHVTYYTIGTKSGK